MFYVTGCRDEGIHGTERVIFYNRTFNVLESSNASLGLKGFLLVPSIRFELEFCSFLEDAISWNCQWLKLQKLK